MSEVYNKLEKLYRKYHPAQFNMAIAQLLEIGFRNAAELTDKEINKAKGNAMMTDKFWQDTLKLVREIAQDYSSVEFMQFCEVMEPLDIRWFSKHPTRDDLETLMERAIESLRYRLRLSDEDIVDELSIDDEDIAEFFGLDYEEEDE